MIVTRTPLRISFLGGGTDYPEWYLQHGGLCVGGTIDKYSYVSARILPPYHAYKTRLVYSEIETVHQTSEIKHPAIRATLELMSLGEPFGAGLEITHLGDLPGGSGLGSSSAFVVGLVHALAALKGEFAFGHQLAGTAIHIERDLLGETVGAQDQTWAAQGGLGFIRFDKNGLPAVTPLPLSQEAVTDLEAHLALYWTGTTRMASVVSRGYMPALATNTRHQGAMLRLAEEGCAAVGRHDWKKLGFLMDQAWMLKRALRGVTTEAIDRAYAVARMAGAVGGKLLGAGGGGFLLFVLPSPLARRGLTEVMEAQGLPEVGFRFEFGGSSLVLAERNGS